MQKKFPITDVIYWGNIFNSSGGGVLNMNMKAFFWMALVGMDVFEVLAVGLAIVYTGGSQNKGYYSGVP